MKKIYALLFALTLVFTGVLANTATAEAACSPTGYLNSGGRCAVSYTNTYANTNTYRNTQVAQLEAYVQQLLALIEQLKALQGDVGGYSDVDVVTRSATDISDDSATLRGEVDFNNEDEATVYFLYGKASTNLRYNTTHVVLDADDDDEVFEHGITNLDDDTRYYYRAVAEDENGRRDYGLIVSFVTDDHGGSSSGDDEPDADADSARNITDDSAELRGSVDMNDFRNGIVFFVYGEDESQVRDVEDDYDEYTDIDEDGDDLQKVRVDTDLDGDDDYRYTVYDLDNDTDIFFSICVEYEDEDDDQTIICSSVEEFTTGDDGGSSNDEPDVSTGSATSITDDSARIRGSVDMNDFDSGIVFFVYGEDESQVDDIEDDYNEYADVDEDGDDLQKIKVDNDLDGDADYTAYFDGLDNDTDIFYSICVEYEDDDNDQVIKCGSTREFTTDN